MDELAMLHLLENDPQISAEDLADALNEKEADVLRANVT